MSIRRGERKERARGMVDPYKGCVGDKVVGLSAAIVGVGPPGNVGQEASGVTQAPIFPVLLEMCRREQAAGPIEEFLPMGGRSRAQPIELSRRNDERVLLLRLQRKLRV